MESAIASPGAYERGHGFELDLPEWISSGGKGTIRSFNRNPLKSIALMPESTEPFFKKPSVLIGSLKDLLPLTLKLVSPESTEPFFKKPSVLIGSLKDLLPLTLKLVSGSELEPAWDYYVKQFHYLGYQKLLGHRLKYLALVRDHPVAALSWSAPALKIGDRDRFIGWSEDQRITYLTRIANNSRFLILPWVNVRNLASHVLSLNIKRLVSDWEQQFNKRLWLLENA